MFRKYILSLILIISINSNLFAAVGCQLNNNGTVYRTSGIFDSWSNPLQDECPKGAATSVTYAYVTSSAGGSCSTGWWGLGDRGMLVNYDVRNCPIDDYIPLLILGVSAFGFLFLRKN